MATSGAGRLPLMRMASDKLAVVGDRVIIAGTGAVGLGQRFQDVVQKAWDKKAFNGKCVDCCRVLSHDAVNDFRGTGVPFVQDQGYGFGALLAAPLEDRAQLVEFGTNDLQPEIKSDKLNFVSMGSGQMLAEPFMGFISRVIWAGNMPNVQSATLGVYWALRHAIQMAPGGVGEPIRIATLTRQKGHWMARILEDEELQEVGQHIDAIEERIRQYPAGVLREAAAQPLPEPPKSGA
ncbi:hypothetical protein GGR25_002762 [Kaistia hirudinis]|uniref:Uncharacterized protein n=2 Tax=Kaistia hirudinis TaxID=1293440 RepID=A0A840AQ07_9HYPH|nr:hypothetical protein [Kaistia hirudinis]